MKYKTLERCVIDICTEQVSIDDVEEVEYATHYPPKIGNDWVHIIDVFSRSYWSNLDPIKAYDTVLDLLHFKKIKVVSLS